MSCAERHFPAAGGERRVSGAGGGRRGRGGRRRRWQRAGTHAAPRPTWPAALPPPAAAAAAAARCPLTSGGECGDPGHRGVPSAGTGRGGGCIPPAWDAKAASLARCMPPKASGTPGRPPAAHKGPPRAAGGEATHLLFRSTVSLRGVPSPGCPGTSQTRIPVLPRLGNGFPASPRLGASQPPPSSPPQSLIAWTPP